VIFRQLKKLNGYQRDPGSGAEFPDQWWQISLGVPQAETKAIAQALLDFLNVI
jgi:hypothetical protein